MGKLAQYSRPHRGVGIPLGGMICSFYLTYSAADILGCYFDGAVRYLSGEVDSRGNHY